MAETGPATVEMQAVRATGVVAVALIAGNLISFLKTAIVAATLGTGWQMDAFLWAYAVVTLFATLLAQPLTAVLVPVFVSLATRSSEKARGLVNSLLGFSFVALVGVAVVLAMFAPELTRVLLADMSTDGTTLTTHLIWLMFPVVALSGVWGVSQAALTAERVFLVSSLSPYLPTVLVIVAVLVAGSAQAAPAQAVGYSLGAVAQSAILLALMWKKGLGKHWSLDPHAEGLHQTLRLLWPLVATQVLILALPLVDRTMAARYQPGAISALAYGQMIMMATVVVVVTAVQTAILPFLSHQLAEGDPAAFRATLLRALRFLIALLLPASLVLIVLAQPTVRLVFERGSFDASATELTIPAFVAYMVGTVPMAVTFILSRGFNALQDSRTNAVVGVVFLVVVKLILNVLFSELWGYWGLALATSCAYVATSLAMLWIMDKKLGGFVDRGFRGATAKTIGASLVAGAVARWGGSHLALGPGGSLVLGGMLAGIAYVLGASLLKVEEVRGLVRYGVGRLTTSVGRAWQGVIH